VTGAGGLNTTATSLTYSANSDGTGVVGENAGTPNLGTTFKNVPGGMARWVFTGNRN